MTKFSEDIIGKIRLEKIAPAPRWHFLLRSCAFWTFFVVSVLLGSLSFSVVLHVVRSGDWDIFSHLHVNLVTSVVMLLPYFWLLVLTMFAVIAFFNWKCTRHGYRYKRRWIVLGSVALSVLFGSIFFGLGLGRKIDNMMTTTLSIYDQSKHAALTEIWFHPEAGFLSGKIIEVDEIREELVVMDETGKTWSVRDEGVQWEDTDLEIKGKIVKIIGSKVGENCFDAKEIRRCANCDDDEDSVVVEK